MTISLWAGFLLVGFVAAMLGFVLRVEHLAALCGFLQSLCRAAGDLGYRTFGALGIALLEARDSYHRHQQRLREDLENQRT